MSYVRKVALVPLVTIIVSIILFFSLDLYTILIYREEARVQKYIAGFYVAGMSADPAELASGKTSSNDLYKNDAILREFVNYAYTAFEPVTTVDPPDKEDLLRSIDGLDKEIELHFPVGEGFIESIVAKCEILSGGVAVHIGYYIDPKINVLFSDGEGLDPYFIYTSGNFRILGQ